MDGSRFDTFARSVSTAGSRRRALGALLAGTLGLLGARAEEAAAKKCKKITNKAKRKKCLAKARDDQPTTGPPEACPVGQKPCGAGCIPTNQCCANSDCPAAAPRCCAGACTTAECCTSADCGGGTICQSGGCLCPAGRPQCNLPSGTICCQPTPGMTVGLVSCGFLGDVPTCFCDYPAVGNCASNCTNASCGVSGDCYNPPSRQTICSFCGCSPP